MTDAVEPVAVVAAGSEADAGVGFIVGADALDAREAGATAGDVSGAAVCGRFGVVSIGANSTRLLVRGLFVSAGGGVFASARSTRSDANGDSPSTPLDDKGPSLANSPFAPPLAPLPGVRGGSFRATFLGGAAIETGDSFTSLMLPVLSFADI